VRHPPHQRINSAFTALAGASLEELRTANTAKAASNDAKGSSCLQLTGTGARSCQARLKGQNCDSADFETTANSPKFARPFTGHSLRRAA